MEQKVYDKLSKEVVAKNLVERADKAVISARAELIEKTRVQAKAATDATTMGAKQITKAEVNISMEKLAAEQKLKAAEEFLAINKNLESINPIKMEKAVAKAEKAALKATAKAEKARIATLPKADRPAAIKDTAVKAEAEAAQKAEEAAQAVKKAQEQSIAATGAKTQQLKK